MIHGISIGDLDEAGIRFIHQALLDHCVVFFRDQVLSPAELLAAAARFGTPVPYPHVEGLPGLPEVIEVRKLPEETVNFGGVWHSDTAYLESPAAAALLYAVQTPDEGGDTIFTNMYDVFDSLSPGLKSLLESLEAINDADKAGIAATRPEGAMRGLRAEHPVVRTHPETGRKLLYVNRAHTTQFSGWTPDESAGLLNYLFDVIEQPVFSYRFKWSPGSLAFWDNRACQHFPVNDYHGSHRLMHRVSLGGEKPV
jgi:taurine dioxygenase